MASATLKTLAVIPARGGSKRLPRKNVLDLEGKPLIAWSIEAARNSGCCDAVVVSTDDPEVARVAEQAGVRRAGPQVAVETVRALLDGLEAFRGALGGEEAGGQLAGVVLGLGEGEVHVSSPFRRLLAQRFAAGSPRPT